MKLEKISSISWEEIWQRWRVDEEEIWRDHYQERGHDNWDSWRGEAVKKHHPDTWSWTLYKANEFLKDVPNMFVGTFPGWRSFFSDREHSRFKDIAVYSGFLGGQTHEKTESILNDFPKETRLVGVRYGDEIMIVEGTHRSTAIAVAVSEGRKINAEVTIALTELTDKQWDLYFKKFMRISSPTFNHQTLIPSLFTCDGENTSPPLVFEDVPEGAVSLALVMEDPDVPTSIRPDGMWDHWVVWNVPASTKEITAGENPPGVVGLSTRGVNAYGGPCPPDREHRYFFYLYALDSMLELPEASTKTDLLAAMEGHVIERAELMGRYERQ
jgi:Raf kinase inhibitor-like YbhB/YbcL family protein